MGIIHHIIPTTVVNVKKQWCTFEGTVTLSETKVYSFSTCFLDTVVLFLALKKASSMKYFIMSNREIIDWAFTSGFIL